MNNDYLNNFKNGPIYTDRSSIKSSQEYIPIEQSYIENILRGNKGKRVCIYQAFPNEPNDATFTGIIEQCGKDHIILSDPNTGNWYLLLMRYVNYIKFDEEINTAKQFYSSNS